MKTATRVIVGILAGLLWLLARGMRLNPNELDQAVGLAVHLVAVLMLFVVFFRWRRTALSGPAFAKHRVLLVWGQFIGGATILLAVLSLLFAGTFGGQVSQLIVSSQIGLPAAVLLLVTAVAALIAGVGLLRGANWAKSLARLVAFPFSFGWPLGLLLALYTWWALAPAPHQQRP